MNLHEVTERHDGPPLQIDCPSCDAFDVRAETWCQVDRIYCCGVQVQTVHRTFIECSACRGRLTTTTPLEELSQCSPREIAEHVRPHVGFVARVMAIVAIVLCMCPFVGLITSTVAVFTQGRARSFMRSLASVALAVSLLITTAFSAILVFGALRAE